LAGGIGGGFRRETGGCGGVARRRSIAAVSMLTERRQRVSFNPLLKRRKALPGEGFDAVHSSLS
jgi:hypothetical protein